MLHSLLAPARGVLRRSALARSLVRPVFAVQGAARARAQQRLVQHELGSQMALERLTASEPLPAGYAVGATERAVEVPWLFAQRPAGKMLDAGSALNHAAYLDRLQPLVSELHIVTLAYEGVAYPERGISYAFADLRALPYLDGYFDTVASISTLEHVGMDNTDYGATSPQAADPGKEAELAVRELMRTVRPGGQLLLTVPYGRREDHGRFRQFNREDLERLIESALPAESKTSIYRYAESGWELSDLDRAADARYRTDFAAEAVACVRLVR